MSQPVPARAAGPLGAQRRLRLEAICLPLALVAAALVVAGPSARVWVYLWRRSDPSSSDLLIQLFDLSTENNIPTWFSSVLLLLAAVSAGAVALLRRRRLPPPLLRRLNSARHYSVDEERDAGEEPESRWTVFAAGLALLSLDEVASLHERLGNVVGGEWLGDRAVGLLRHAWVVPGALVAVVLLVGCRRLARDLPPRARTWFLFAGGLYFLGAVVIESLSGLVLDQSGDRAGYIAVTALEEASEMAGALLLLRTLLGLLDVRSTSDGGLTVSLAGSDPAAG